MCVVSVAVLEQVLYWQLTRLSSQPARVWLRETRSRGARPFRVRVSWLCETIYGGTLSEEWVIPQIEWLFSDWLLRIKWLPTKRLPQQLFVNRYTNTSYFGDNFVPKGFYTMLLREISTCQWHAICMYFFQWMKNRMGMGNRNRTWFAQKLHGQLLHE